MSAVFFLIVEGAFDFFCLGYLVLDLDSKFILNLVLHSADIDHNYCAYGYGYAGNGCNNHGN